MKKISFILILMCVIFTAKSQSNYSVSNLTAGNWQNAVLLATGLTEVEGVEAYCMKASCDNEEFVLVKFVNKNNFRVGVEWVDAIYVNGEWYYSKNPNPKKLYLEPGETVGACGGEIKLKVKINSIIEVPANSGHYTVSGLKIIK